MASIPVGSSWIRSSRPGIGREPSASRGPCGEARAMDDTGLRVALDSLITDNERALRGIAELQQQIETLIEIMVAAGTLKPGHAELVAKLRRRVEVAGRAEVELSPTEDKYAVPGEPIDCESRLHLCHARCCSFQVALSRQDVAEGELAWDIDQPYRLSR